MRFPRLLGLLPLGVLLSASCSDDGQLLGTRNSGAGTAGSAGSGGDSSAAGDGSSGLGSAAKSGSSSGAAGSSGATGNSGATGGTAASGGTAGRASGATGGDSGTGATDGATGGDASGATGGNGATSGTGAAGEGATGGSGGSSGHPCGASAACDLVPTDCCGYCGNSTVDQWFAIATEDYTDYQIANCSDVACPACVTRRMPNIAAVCRNDECVAVDITMDELSACTVNEDCRLRWGTGCCEGCDADSGDLIALAKSVNATAAFCGTKVPPCCAPAAYPSNAQPFCIEGFCRVGIN